MAVARTLELATAALDFEIPLESNDPRFVDFAAVRGGGSVERLKKLLQRQSPDQWLHAVFASHRGAGKSTEIKRLAHDLGDKYYSIYFEATVELDATSFEMEDLLLVIARVVEERMRIRGTPLPKAELAKVERFFADVVFSDEYGQSYLADIRTEAKAESGIPFFAKLTAALTASMKRTSDHKETIKRQVKRFPGALMTHVNNLLSAANEQLVKDGRRLLLLIDNMDRYKPQVIDELLIASQDVFKSLQCHLIVTPPIDLVLTPETQSIENVFHCETMPTVKLREKNQGYWEFSGEGRSKLLEALRKRIDLEKLIPDATARDRLVSASGGGIRELLEMTQSATLDATGAVITADDVELTLNRHRSWLRNRMDANGWWEALAEIAATKRLSDDPKQLDVVFQRLAFQYNGDVWYDVHPLVSDLLTSHTSETKQKGTSRAAAKKKTAVKKNSAIKKKGLS